MATHHSRVNLAQLIDTTWQDLRFAIRQHKRRPGFAALIVLTLAVGIGGSTAIFSVLKGVVLRDLPYPEPERLVAVWEAQSERRSYQPFSAPDYFDVRRQTQQLEEFGVMTLRWFNLVGDGEPVRLLGSDCTASLFQLLGVPPLHGRLFVEDEESEGNHQVVILSFRLWQNQFGGDPSVLGTKILVDSMPFEIVGIMPERFEFPTPWGGRDKSQLWAPAVLPREDSSRSWHWLGAFGRLAPGATPAEAEAELKTIAAQLSEAYPNTNAKTVMWVEPMMERTLGSVRSGLTYLLCIVGLVLLIACANVASMLLARGAQRMPELALRGSIGASRLRLARQLLTECLLLSGIGGLAGLVLAYWGVGALTSILPENLPRVSGVQVDPSVLAFTAATTILCGLLFGLAPALVASRTKLAAVLKESQAARGGGRGRARFLSGLVALQIAIGLIVVNAAALLLISYTNVLSQEMNFETDETIVAGISLSGPAYEEPHQRRAFYDRLLAHVRALPGVTHAGLTNKLPLRGGSNGDVLVNDQVFDPMTKTPLVEHSFIDEGYLDAMGIPLLSGRTFTRTDLEVSSAAAGQEISPVELPVVINETMAERLWPEEQALGKLVRPRSATESYRARVVGIVGDVMQWGAERETLPEMYFPYTAEVWGPPRANLVVRTEQGSGSLVASVRQAVRGIDAQIPVAAPSTMNDVLYEATGRRRFSMILVSLFAATAMLLIVAGTYGVMSYAVSQRTHEIGVRIALGADRTRVFRHFLARAARLFGPGLAVGLLGAVAASLMTRSMVFGVSATNPAYIAAAVAALVAVTLIAIAIPVRRATRVNPVEALKAE